MKETERKKQVKKIKGGEKMIELLKRQKGITLIALVITIIVLIILAAVSISMLTGENGILTKANEAKEAMEKANILEQIQVKIFEKQATLYRTQITKEDMEEILEQYGTLTYEADGTTLKGITTSKGNYEILLTEVYQGTLVAETPTGPTTDGSWNGTINTPKLMTGMTAIAWDSSKNEITPTTNEEWYDYTTNKWANAITKDSNGKITGYYVWIPRYEYSISGTTVNVKFIQTTQTTVDGGYTYIHPAFRNGSSNNFKNGEWDAEISGFWVAKYPAGFQASTIDTSGNLTNGSDTVQYSNLNYTYNQYTTNAIGQNLSSYATQKLSYPVFKPQTYAYNCITTSDIYRISQDIKNASSFYGLNSSQTDTHMMKNSEWGAVAYLTQSTYGRNGTEPNINNLNLNNKDSKNIYAVTGFAGAGTSTASETTIANVNGYKTGTGELGSSTGNITGVYDLNGCVWEYTAGYITNGNANLSTYGSSYAATTANVNGYLTNSTKYATAYPYNSSSDTQPNNWTAYNNLKSSSYGYGDAILETSTSGASPYTNSWNSDYSYFPTTSAPFFVRGGSYGYGSNAGSFAFIFNAGYSSCIFGSRLVLFAL